VKKDRLGKKRSRESIRGWQGGCRWRRVPAKLGKKEEEKPGSWFGETNRGTKKDNREGSSAPTAGTERRVTANLLLPWRNQGSGLGDRGKATYEIGYSTKGEMGLLKTTSNFQTTERSLLNGERFSGWMKEEKRQGKTPKRRS